MRKSLRIFAVASVISIMSTMTSMAGWEQVGTQWKYQNTDGSYAVGWQWLDGNNDGVAECYYLDGNGIMAVNTVVDGYTVDINGAWVINGVVQTKVVGSGGQSSNTNSGGHQNQSGIPSLDDITNHNVSEIIDDSTGFESGDSTGLPPMQAGTGGHQNQSGIPSLDDITGGTSSNMDNSDVQAGDSTGLPPMH